MATNPLSSANPHSPVQVTGRATKTPSLFRIGSNQPQIKTTVQQTTRQRDIKAPNGTPSTAGIHHLFLATFVTIALFAVYVLINTPSASTTNLVEINPSDHFPKSNIAQSVLPQTVASINLKLISLPSVSEPAVELLDQSNQSRANQSRVNQSRANQSRANQSRAYLQSQPWIITKVRGGDSLSRIFKRNGLNAKHAYQITRLQEAGSLLKIQPGQNIRIKKDRQGEFALLHYQLNMIETLTVRPVDDQFVAKVTKREAEIRINNAKATIDQHLLGAAKKANISLKTMYNFIAIFGWQVDFTMDLRVGDQFSIIYEERYIDDEKIADGEIIAAELVLSGKVLQAIRHKDEADVTHYYTPDGGGIKGTFLRTPLKFGHVTSNFSNNRFHPVKKVWRAHKGVDYGAPRGTPVLTTGDGKVKLASRSGDYGKTVIIQHGGKYNTVYAHLSSYAKGIRPGVQVKQGQTIGYVGSTGLATGPHLHYEFRINGVHKNPITVELPKSAPIADQYKSQFRQVARIWVAELQHLKQIPLALTNIAQRLDSN